jgi:hypothetical protein
MQATPEVLDVLAAYQGVSLPPHRVAEAAQGYAGLAAKILEMRAVPFTFLESVIEPACADRWIEDGGRSR